MTGRRFDLFTFLAFIPLVSLVGMSLYVRQYDGWGAMAAAPLLLVPIILSGFIAAFGLARLLRERASGAMARRTLCLTLIASVPFLWFLWRLLVTAI